jgi:hypothetical protein
MSSTRIAITKTLTGYDDDVIGQLGESDALLLCGPGETKLAAERASPSSQGVSERIVAVERSDRLTDPQIVAKVKEHTESPAEPAGIPFHRSALGRRCFMRTSVR